MTTTTSTAEEDVIDLTDEPTEPTVDASAAGPNANTTSEDEAIDAPEDRGNREAARYRRQLRDAESERDTLRGHLAAARMQVLAAATTEIRAKTTMELVPAALADAIDDPAAFFDDDGNLNTTALRDHIRSLYDSKPHWFRQNLNGTMVILAEGTGPERQEPSASWESSFAPPEH